MNVPNATELYTYYWLSGKFYITYIVEEEETLSSTHRRLISWALQIRLTEDRLVRESQMSVSHVLVHARGTQLTDE